VTFIQAVLAIAPSLKEWFDSISKHRRERSEKVESALEALYVALNETRIYVGVLERPPWSKGRSLKELKPVPSRRKGRPTLDMFNGVSSFCAPGRRRNGVREAELSRLWTRAALKLREVQPELAGRCALKGDYWASPESWESADVMAAQIEIHQMRITAAKLLLGR
jgi:hypothetical protein